MSFRTVYGYSISENGWRMCNRDECDLARIPDLYLTETAPIRKGAPLTILGAWLFWYDRNVEEILTSVWGWSATNDVSNSNHLAGTAVDVNAPKYPWGSRTMPADRIAKVRHGLQLFEGSVFWGADWDRADEMHYQMAWNENDARNDRFAAKLLDGYLGIYKPAPTGGSPVDLPQPVRVGPADDQLVMRFNCLGGQTLVEAVAELRDHMLGTADRRKPGVMTQ